MDDNDGLGAAPTQPAASDGRVAIGDCLGRYTVRARLGAGGMGEVFEGHDPELDREVALKVLKPGFAGSSPESRARFQREAQAMAKLNHPNVVVVYDVGTIGEQVFLAMELVRGPTLAAWIAEGEHSWREVVDVFVQAGRGLEAAHAADIVHRDFKPANVILGDRVRVADFGLARSFGESDPVVALAASTLLDQTLTQTGAALGTPKYMAPEQRDGRPVGALADQFAFCVALEEALGDTKVPRSIAALIARGKDPDPDKRFPSMTALLAELGRDRARPRRIAIGAAAVAALAGVGVFALRANRVEPCADPSGRIAVAWDPARKTAVHAAFVATGVPYAEDSWRTVSAVIDRYTESWIAQARESCRATRIESRQSDTLMDLRTACLDERKAVLDDLTVLWSRGMDRDGLEQATSAVTKLPALAGCEDTKALGATPSLPPDPARAAQVTAVRQHLDRIRALVIAHRTSDVKRESALARAEAEATGWSQIRAEASFIDAPMLIEIQDPDTVARLEDTARFAAEANDERLRTHALVDLMGYAAKTQHQSERAKTIADIIDPAVKRLGDRVIEIDYLRSLSGLLIRTNKLAEAHDVLERAAKLFPADDPQTIATNRLRADLAETQGNYAESKKLAEATVVASIKLFGPEHPRVGRARYSLASAEFQLGDFTSALEQFRKALPIIEQQSGPNGIQTGQLLQAIGSAEVMLGHNDASGAAFERALAIFEKMAGPESALVAGVLDDLSQTRTSEGRLPEAVQMLDRSLAIKTKVYGAADSELLITLQNLAVACDHSGDPKRGIATYQRAVEVATQTLGPDHTQTYAIIGGLGAMLARQHRCGEAKPHLAKSLGKLMQDKEPLQDLGSILSGAAMCETPAGALPLLDRAIAVLESMKAAGDELGPIRFQRAQTLAALRRDAEAVATARKAESELAENKGTANELQAVRAWLAAHP